MADVLNQVADKLVRRHPHVYGDEEVKDEEAVKKNWEKIKLQEKGVQSVLEGVPSSLPALIKAMRIQEKVKGVGFDWEESSQVWEKVQEELQEFKNEIDVQGENSIDPLKVQSEFGDLLFSLINYARFVDINPEEALERTNKKFIHRFQYLEDQARKIGKPMSEMTLAEMDVFWEEAKNIE
jgi:XTP/dITP diphosphohydrolase